MALKKKRLAIVLGLAGVVIAGAILGFRTLFAFPPDTTPEGAYFRIVVELTEGRPRGCFAYLEDKAQHAAYSIRSYRKQASDRIAKSYPEPERARLLAAYASHANAPDGADIWLEMAQRNGWIGRLKRDLSGIAHIETSGDRSTIETSRGTRYTFRRREAGIWGLTTFTAELVAESERAARDADIVSKAADDFDAARPR